MKTINISEADNEFLKQNNISSTSLFRAAIQQVRSKDMFIDKEFDYYDKEHLLKEVTKLRGAIQVMQDHINLLNQEVENVELAKKNSESADKP